MENSTSVSDVYVNVAKIKNSAGVVIELELIGKCVMLLLLAMRSVTP